MNTTCQVCGRDIKAKTGLIAHHGYTRPGGGWQTESCAGAKNLPYEQSCDVLPNVIATTRDYIGQTETNKKTFAENPPNELIWKGFFDNEFVVLRRPEGFNPEGENFIRRPGTYENEYNKKLYEMEKAIEMAKFDLIFMENRLKNWIPPKELL